MRAAVIIALSTVLLPACFLGPAHRVTDQVSLTDDAQFVDVDLGSGDLRVTVENREDIFIERTVHYGNRPPELRAEVMGGVLYIEADCPKLTTNCGADHVIHLPSDAQLLLHTGSGQIDVEGVFGSVDADTGSGDVELIDVTGDIVVNTGSGDVTAVGLTSQFVTVDTGSGDVDVSLHQAASDLWIDTGSGEVRVETPSGAYRITTDTGSGDVELRGVQRSVNADSRIDVGTGSGDIDILGR